MDGSGWAKTIPLLKAEGYRVTAAQNPLTWLAGDRTANPDMQRAIAQKINATTRTVPGSHLFIMTQPALVAAAIIGSAQQISA